MSATVAETLLTAEQYALLPDNGVPTELIRGRVVRMNMPAPRHGYYCNKVGRILGNFAEEHDLGRVMNNDSGIITDRGPDTVRGAAVCYYSYLRVPKGPLPQGYLPVVPELIFEIRSPGDRIGRIYTKIGEYLEAGVSVVCLLDTEAESLTIFRQNEELRVLTSEDELTLPEVFGDQFRVPVSRF